MIFESRPLTRERYDLAEGILWDDRHHVVRWVDIWQGRVMAGELRHGELVVLDTVTLGQTAGAVALAEDGGLLIAAARCLATVAPSGEVSFGPDLLGNRTGVRFNDGSVDPFGAFIVGTLTIGGDTGHEELLRVHPDGVVETLRTGVRLSNGVSFSPDGHTIYHVDTFAMTVSSHSYGPGAFDLDEPWVTVLGPDDLPAYPDGLCVDRDGMLWVAQFGGASVRRHSPSGELLDLVVVDAEQVTCAAFVGSDLEQLAITTAQEGLGSVTDGAGALFVADVGVRGLPSFRWAGSTTVPSWLDGRQNR